MIVADSSGLLALLDRGEAWHGRVKKVVDAIRGPLVVTDFVLAEVDHLVMTRLGAKAERAFLDQLIGGAFMREEVSLGDLKRARAIVGQYADQDLGLTDATLMAVAERLRVPQVLTLDRRHFAPFRNAKGGSFEILPA